MLDILIILGLELGGTTNFGPDLNGCGSTGASGAAGAVGRVVVVIPTFEICLARAEGRSLILAVMTLS